MLLPDCTPDHENSSSVRDLTHMKSSIPNDPLLRLIKLWYPFLHVYSLQGYPKILANRITEQVTTLIYTGLEITTVGEPAIGCISFKASSNALHIVQPYLHFVGISVNCVILHALYYIV
jgi:hypothetical protein